MKLAVVAPPQQPELALLGDIHLCQANWILKYPKYAATYIDIARMGGFVIMDWQHVGEKAESTTASWDQFFAAIDLVHPAEIVIPDAFQQYDETLDNLARFMKDERTYYYKHNGGRVMFIPQGQHIDEWEKCLREATDPYDYDQAAFIDTIGIPKVLDSWDRYLRYEATGLVPRRYDVHLLGVWGGVADVIGPKWPIRSLDTSLPVAAAQNGIYLGKSEQTMRMKFQLDYSEGAEHANEDLVLRNVDLLKDRCHDGVQMIDTSAPI